MASGDCEVDLVEKLIELKGRKSQRLKANSYQLNPTSKIILLSIAFFKTSL
jgi:hypothetical protein